MSLSRNLVDLYVLASGVTRAGSCIISSQTSALCLHVKTSSLLNPTPISDAYAKPQQSEQPEQPEHKIQETQHTSEAAIEVPFPNFVEKATDEPVYIKNEVVETVTIETPAVINSVAKDTEIIKTTLVEETIKPIQIETPTAETIVEEVIIKEKRRELKESRIPTSRFGRLWNYGTLATGMGMGAMSETLKRATGLSQDTSGKIKIYVQRT